MARLPHAGVYARLKPSRIDGVGVFAIRDIPKGMYVFSGDDDEMVWVDASTVNRLEAEAKKLYRDFCVTRNGRFGCPRNFNLLTLAWYLNHSSKPNMAADENYNFYSTRRIRKGEELTVDYDTYSHSQPRLQKR
jgi:SET domain-containing protein